MLAVFCFIALAGFSRLADSFYHNSILVRTARSSLSAASSPDDFADLTKKLLEKKEAAKIVAPSTGKETKKVESKVVPVPTPKPVVKVAPVAPAAPAPAKVVAPAAPVKVAPVPAKTVETVKVVAPVQKVEKIIEVPSTPPPSAVASSTDVILGIGLGLAPYIAIPIILFNSLKGLLKKPKPLPVVEPPKPKVPPYAKSLGEGLKEGIEELLSGKSTPELDLTRKGIKLSVGGFSVAALFTGLLLVLNGGNSEQKPVAPTSAPPAAKVAPAPAPVPKPAPTPEPVKVAPKPAPVPAPEPVKVAPAPAPVPAPEPVKVAPVPAPVPVPEPVKVAPAPVPAPVPAPEPVKVAPAPVPAPEPVKVAPAPVPAPAPKPAPAASSSDEVVEIYVPKTPQKGLEPDTINLDALKSFRVSSHPFFPCYYHLTNQSFSIHYYLNRKPRNRFPVVLGSFLHRKVL